MDKRTPEVKSWGSRMGVFLIIFIYLFLRLGWPDTIEFGYDQPLLSNQILSFLKNPTFLKSFDFVTENPWGYPSWGVSQIFFYALFFLISKNPLTLSLLIAIFNLLSVLCIFYIGKEHFSTRVGLIAALFLATNPWWIIFSRMIYQPTPVPSIIALSMLIFFEVVTGRRKLLIVPLMLSLSVLSQFYIHTFSFIVASIALLTLRLRLINIKLFILGILLSFIFLLPAINFYSKNQEFFWKFTEVSQKFETFKAEEPHTPIGIFGEYLKTLGGTGFKWQLGYGFEDFSRILPYLNFVSYFLILFSSFVLAYSVVKIALNLRSEFKRLALLLWTIGPLWFLILLGTPISLPRYFILSLPSFSLLIGLCFSEIFAERKKIIFAAISVVPAFWIILTISYYEFVKSYSYKNGFLSYFADVPYSFLERGFKWILGDAKSKGYKEFTVSDDLEKQFEFSLNQAQSYYWREVLSKREDITGFKPGHYFMRFTDGKVVPGAKQFGPYIIYEAPSKR